MPSNRSQSSPRIVAIAGSDSSGGAGLHADLRAIAGHGCYGLSVITAVTAQNRLGVSQLLAIPPELIGRQLQSILEEASIDAVKIGMTGWPETIHAIREGLDRLPAIPTVLDPVMRATSGSNLITSEAIDCLRAELMPRCTIATPNLREAEALLGRRLKSDSQVEAGASDLLELGVELAVITGGDRGGENSDDCAAYQGKVYWLRAPRQRGNRRGTGCTFASSIACHLARGLSPLSAVEAAKEYMFRCLQ